jgi:putative FmdB family regulatory protein
MTYFFVCENCKLIFEKKMSIQQYETSTVHICPECKSTSTKRFYTGTPYIIYGDGGFTKYVKRENE